MTPTATYIAEENCLQEESRVEKPERDYDDYDPYSEHWNYWVGEWREYENHLATLRKIPCDPSCKGLWADGQKVVEGKDYEVKTKCTGKSADCLTIKNCQYCESMAFPLVPVKSEDEFQKSIDEMDEESKLFVDKSMAIANRISELLEKKGLKQKDLAIMMGKTESEISRMLAGMQNLTLRMISKVEAVLESDVICIPEAK